MSNEPSMKPRHATQNPSAFADALDDVTVAILAAVARVANDLSIDAFLVGGMVRDMVAGQKFMRTSPDVAVVGDAASFASAMASEINGATMASASLHHTAKVKIGPVLVDIASARQDTYEPFGSLPQITLVDDIRLDLSRRDFTANAMAVPIYQDGFGDLIDPFDGHADVLNRTLRVIREHSFAEDPLRMLRGARLAARYQYAFDSETTKQIDESLHHLQNMCDRSPQRVFNEFHSWFDPRENLAELVSIAARYELIGALGISDDLQYAALRNIRQSASQMERFAAFAYHIPSETMDSFVESLKMPTEWRSVVRDVNQARKVVDRCRSDALNDVEMHRYLIDIRDDVVRAIISIDPDASVGRHFDDFRHRLRHIRPELNGNALIALGVERGPMVQKLLDELLERRIEGSLANAADERDFIIRRLSGD